MNNNRCDSCNAILEESYYFITRKDDDQKKFRICITCNTALTDLIEEGFVEDLSNDVIADNKSV